MRRSMLNVLAFLLTVFSCSAAYLHLQSLATIQRIDLSFQASLPLRDVVHMYEKEFNCYSIGAELSEANKRALVDEFLPAHLSKLNYRFSALYKCGNVIAASFGLQMDADVEVQRWAEAVLCADSTRWELGDLIVRGPSSRAPRYTHCADRR